MSKLPHNVIYDDPVAMLWKTKEMLRPTTRLPSSI